MEPHSLTSGISESLEDGISSRYPDLVLQRGKVGLQQFSTESSECPTSSTAELKSQNYSGDFVANMVNDNVIMTEGEINGEKKCCNVCRRSCCSCRSKSEDHGESKGGKENNSVTVTFDDGFAIDGGYSKPGRTGLGNDVQVATYGRKWEHFPGKNNFYFNGRLMTAPSVKFCMLSFLLILITFVLFTVFDGPFFAKEISIAIPIIGSVLFILVIVNMVKTSCSDPGILPRASAQESEFIEKTYASANGMRPPPRTKDIVVNGQTIKSKYCFTCKMFRPPRASHCSVCDNCVDRFDHHCPFLGNCIGKRNYRNFYAFIVCLSLLAVFVLSFSITKLAMLGKQHGNFLDALRESPTSAVVILISFFGMWTVIGLAGFHSYLIAVDQTTNEDIKGIFGRANVINPYSKGNPCQNCCFILCGPHHPSLIDSRGYVTADFLASLPKKNGGNDTAMSSQNPPTSIQPHFQDKAGLSTRDIVPGQVGVTSMYQNNGGMESGGQKMISSQVVSSIPPNINNSSSFHFPKAGTVPADSVGAFPGYHSSKALNYESSDETLLENGKSPWAPKLQAKSMASRSMNARSYTNPDHNSIEDDEAVMSMVELDHLGNLQRHSKPQTRNSQHHGYESGKLSTSIPLISNSSSATTSTTTDNSHYKKLSRKMPISGSSSYARQSKSSANLTSAHSGDLLTSSSPKFPATTSLSAVNAPVALAFGNPNGELTTTNLERFTMINSPLHLDSIS